MISLTNGVYTCVSISLDPRASQSKSLPLPLLNCYTHFQIIGNIWQSKKIRHQLSSDPLYFPEYSTYGHENFAWYVKYIKTRSQTKTGKIGSIFQIYWQKTVKICKFAFPHDRVNPTWCGLFLQSLVWGGQYGPLPYFG